MTDGVSSRSPTGWARFWQQIQAMEEAMHMTPLDFVEARVAGLERRMAALETGASAKTPADPA